MQRAVQQPAASAEAAPTLHDRTPQARILDVARELFCRDGIHATGIDRILAAAGASKMTLYARFGSKEALVRAVLRQEGTDWRAAYFAALSAAAPDAAGRLRHAVAALDAWMRGGRFYGCAFMNAAAEHTKGASWLRELAADHHRQILAFLAAEAQAAGAADPAILARQILLVIDGAIAALMVSGDAEVLTIAARNLAAVLDQAQI